MFNREITGNLARLLATENLVVEHRKVSTASFDVDRRVLTLPMWQKASNTVYDMLVGHEVGHALFTPTDLWNFGSIPKDLINIVEDARIEKLIKRKFPGLSRDFYNGYKELNETDFFGIKEDDISTFNLMDRINLHFKIGSYSLIPFEENEKIFIKMIEEVETFEQVVSICQQIMDFINKKQEEQEELQAVSTSSNQNGNEEVENNEQSSSSELSPQSSVEGDGESNDSSNDDSSKGFSSPSSPGGPSDEDETVSKTQSSFDRNAENLSTHEPHLEEIVYLERADVNIDNVIVDFKTIFDHVEEHFNNQSLERKSHWGNIFEEVDSSYLSYKKESQKEVNYLVKEFECKKSADAYSRSFESKTGVLNTKLLHTYKYNENLFKTVNVIPDGKNHGMIFVLDWSGSMANCMMDTVKQLLNLCWFCKKVQIPFDVYAFTYEWNSKYVSSYYDDYDGEKMYEENYVRGHNKIGVHKRFSLLNIITSKSSSSEFEKSLLNLYRISKTFRSYSGYYSIPLGFDLSGTPLNETILALHKVIPMFKQKSKAQKVNLCILTDGESNGISYDVDVSHVRGYSHIGKNTVSSHCSLRDRKLGKIYRKFDGYSHRDGITTILIENLKDNFPDVSITGFRISTTSEFGSTYRDINECYGYGAADSAIKKWKKEKSWEFEKVGYDRLYYISNTNLSSDSEFEVSSDASKTEISKAFRTMLKSTTTNKKILSSFIGAIS